MGRAGKFWFRVGGVGVFFCRRWSRLVEVFLESGWGERGEGFLG